METKKLLVSLVAILAFVLLFANFCNAGSVAIKSVKINGVSVNNVNTDLALSAGKTVDVDVEITAENLSVSEAQIVAEITGISGASASSEIFPIVGGTKTYARTISIKLPHDIDPTEARSLAVTVESEGELARALYPFTIARPAYALEFLDVSMDNKAKAGETVNVDVVLKNRGYNSAQDAFVRVKIPLLGVEEKAYFSDIYSTDNTEDDQSDAAEGKVVLKIPSNAKPGIYNVEIEAYNADTSTTSTKKLVVVGASEDSIVASPVTSKTFSAGSSAEYSLTLVNSGEKVKVYEISIEAPTGLSAEVDESLVAIPAGTSKTVKLKVSSSKVGVYDFTASVQSAGELIKKENFVANVEKSNVTNIVGGGDATVLLTVVLAIIFVVLLIVLIVLLTRKPEKKEFGESYY
jgi:hypothetical protein